MTTESRPEEGASRSDPPLTAEQRTTLAELAELMADLTVRGDAMRAERLRRGKGMDRI